MRRFSVLAFLGWVLLHVLAPGAAAHEMSIAEMDLREIRKGEFIWQWGASGNTPVGDSLRPNWPSHCTVEENLLAILQTLPGVSRAEQRRRCDALMEQFGLKVKAREEARTCSGGERRRLEIARALITNPKLMLLDEPFAAVDPHTVEELQAEVRKLAARGIAVLVTDHNVQQTLRICDRAYIIHQGRNLREGDPKSIINDPMVREAYLASTFRGDEFD